MDIKRLIKQLELVSKRLADSDLLVMSTVVAAAISAITSISKERDTLLAEREQLLAQEHISTVKVFNDTSDYEADEDRDLTWNIREEQFTSLGKGEHKLYANAVPAQQVEVDSKFVTFALALGQSKRGETVTIPSGTEAEFFEWLASSDEQPSPAVAVPELESVEGDLLPPIGCGVAIHLASCDKWVNHTVVGYYVWGPLGGISDSYSRVFVRVVDDQGILNARLLKDVKWDKNTPLRTLQSPRITEQEFSDDEYICIRDAIDRLISAVGKDVDGDQSECSLCAEFIDELIKDVIVPLKIEWFENDDDCGYRNAVERVTEQDFIEILSSYSAYAGADGGMYISAWLSTHEGRALFNDLNAKPESVGG